MVEFCPEHSNVMEKLGELKQGQEGLREICLEIRGKVECIGGKQTDVRIVAAQEKTKSSILYWVIGIASGGLILALINLIFKALGVWKG